MVPRVILQSVSSIFLCSPLHSGTWRTPGLSIPRCCLLTSSSVCFILSPPFTVPCKMILAISDEQWAVGRSFGPLLEGIRRYLPPPVYQLGKTAGVNTAPPGGCSKTKRLAEFFGNFKKQPPWRVYKQIMHHLYGVLPKGLLTFLWFFLCNAEFSPCSALPEYIRALIHLACLRVFSVTPWVIVYRFRLRWQKQSEWF